MSRKSDDVNTVLPKAQVPKAQVPKAQGYKVEGPGTEYIRGEACR